ncbi:MAG: nucleotidyl transferase AbiEii/AbiGii toxin family protein [Bacteroidota bacterium]
MMKLQPQHKCAIEAARAFIEQGEFYLAGGTAVYYYLNHRESMDLDFFTQKDFDFSQYEYLLKSQLILFQTNNTIHAEIEKVKISFFRYPYNLLRPLNRLDTISIAHLEDILCMKINAIINRGSRKDFTDVYFIMQELSISRDKCIELFQAKFGSYNPLIINKAMTYFGDADNEPELKMLKPVRWEEIKKFFIRTFTEL